MLETNDGVVVNEYLVREGLAKGSLIDTMPVLLSKEEVVTDAG